MTITGTQYLVGFSFYTVLVMAENAQEAIANGEEWKRLELAPYLFDRYSQADFGDLTLTQVVPLADAKNIEFITAMYLTEKQLAFPYVTALQERMERERRDRIQAQQRAQAHPQGTAVLTEKKAKAIKKAKKKPAPAKPARPPMSKATREKIRTAALARAEKKRIDKLGQTRAAHDQQLTPPMPSVDLSKFPDSTPDQV